MMELEEARRRILTSIDPLPGERVTLREAAGRFVAEEIRSTVNLPPFDNSAMDGYAVRAAEVQLATAEATAVLRVLGMGAAGEVPQATVGPGACVRVFTGSVLPEGADAVVMQEDTRRVEGSDSVQVVEGVKPWENVRRRGEDVKAGAIVLSPGVRLTAGRVALLAALGATEVLVRRRPVVGLLATGNELVEPGQALAPGKIYESNRAMLARMLERCGACPRVLPLVPDAPEATRAALAGAFHDCDVVVSSGGVSVGELDFVKRAFQELGGSLEFWQVAMKPGKPFVFGRWDRKFFFGLPGNPVSAFVTCLLLVQPALERCQGAVAGGPASGLCTLSEPFTNRADRRHFMRAWVDEDGKAKSAGAQASHLLSSLAAANALVDVPPNRVLEAGALVPFIPFGD